MANILYISTLALNYSAIVFSLVYIWINIFSKISDVSERSTNIYKITKAAMWMSILFALATCLFTRSDDAYMATYRASKLYSNISISWLIVLFCYGIAMLCLFVSKKKFSTVIAKSLKNIFKISMTGASISILLSWLLS